MKKKTQQSLTIQGGSAAFLGPIATLVLFFVSTPVVHSADTPNPVATPNAGHFQIGPFEYFAEERLDQKTPDPTRPRSRLWLMPTLILMPETVEVFNEQGESIDPTEKDPTVPNSPEPTPTADAVTLAQKPDSQVKVSKTSKSPPMTESAPRTTTSPREPRFHGRVVFRLSAPSFSPLTKAVVLAHLRNDPSLRGVPVDDYFYRTVALMDVPQVEALINKSAGLGALLKAAEPLANGYQMEAAVPQRVSVTIGCLNTTIGATLFTPTAMLASTSTVAVDCPALDLKTAKLFYEGRISTTANMEVSLSNVQIAAAEYDLNTFAQAVSKELYDRVTEARSSKKGFLWWGSTSKSVETWMTGSIDQSAVGTSSMRSSIFMRDVSSPRLIDAAMGFIFKPFEVATTDRLAILANDHREAAKQADIENRKDLAEAHRRYADYLDSLRKGNESGDQASKAMEALQKIFAGGGAKGSSSDGAGNTAATAGVASGNPYVAAAMFIAQGIIYKDDRNSDAMHVAQTRKGVWSEADNKQFSGLIATQTVAGYAVSQASFPEIGDLRAKIKTAREKRDAGHKSFTPAELRKLRQDSADEVLKSFAL
jgi:hypothetical protein